MKKLSVLVATVIVAMGASFTSCGDSHKSACELEDFYR